MALTLEDFQTEAPLSLADFKGAVPKGPELNERTAAQLAGGNTILTSGGVEDYQKTKQRLIDPESRQDFIIQQQQLRDVIWSDAQSGLVDIIANPSINDEEKVQSLSTTNITSENLPPFSLVDALTEEAAIADSGVNETERAAESRFSAIETIRSVNESKRRLTKMINSLELGKDAGSLKKLKDVAELIAPFAEWIHIDQLAKDISGKNALENLNLLGEQKKALYNEVANMSEEEKGLLAEKVIGIVQDNATVILPDGNDLVALETLNRMLVDNDYSDAERYFDNVTSVLDIIGLGGAARGFFKAGKVSKTIRGAEEAGLTGETLGPEVKAPSGGAANEPIEDVFDLSPDQWRDTTDETITELKRRALTESTHTEVVPTSPSQVIKDVNPELAREIHKMTAEDETGEAAKALYGSSKEEALAKDILPEPDSLSGNVPNKVEMRRPEFEEPKDIREARLANGNTAVSDSELAKIKEKLISGLENVQGMTLHPASMVFRSNLDSTFGFTARYSPIDSGFSTVEEALDNAEYAFRNFGIPRESFTVLTKQGDQWVKTSTKDIEAKKALTEAAPKLKTVPALNDKEFAIGLEWDYRFKPEDLSEVELLTTAPGVIARAVQFADRLPTQFLASKGQGSVVQNLLDAASVIHPQIVNAASVAVDRAYGLKKLYVDEFEGFTEVYKKLSKERRALMTDYINQANLEGIKFSTADLYSRGFTKKEIEALKQWRRANDAMWYATNEDMVKTLRSRGNEVFVHKASDTKLVGRPIGKQSVSNDWIYDPVENLVVKLGGKRGASINQSFIDELYEKGGKVIKLNQPMQIDGKWTDFVISRNTPDGGYTRKIYDGETVLAYRDGYYPVMYDANFWVDKVIKGDGGKEIRKAVASARDTKDAQAAFRMLHADEPNATFEIRKDRSFSQHGSQIFDEGGWSLSSNSGLTTQRFRGERVQEAGVDLQGRGMNNLKDPLEAVAKQIHQLSQRVTMRTYMDTVKKRWMLNYGDYLKLPRNKLTGQLEMPSSPSQIVGKHGAPGKLVADARSNFNYIYSLENGYINGMDVLYKGLLHGAADLMAELGMSKVERGLLIASKTNPTQQGKTLAFKLLLSASPLRQGVIQRGQILQLGAVNPKYLTTSLAKDLIGIRGASLDLPVDQKYVDLFNEVKASGILEAVDAHNLIRDDMLRLADLSAFDKIRSGAAAPLRWSQKIGFDAAEQDNLLAAWLSFRDIAKQQGKNLKDQRVKDKILGDTRAFTLNMNRAGEMPYSQNTAGLVMQFMSFRHKAFLQGFTNRSLSGKDKAKLLAYTTALWGVNATLLGYAVDQIWGKTPPSEVKDLLKDGLVDFTLNGALTLASGEDQAIDWSDMAPVEAYGMGNLIVGMFSTDAGEMIANNPAGSLFFGNNPRLTDAFKTAMRYFFSINDYDDPTLETKFSDVVKSAASVFSGFSSAFKAQYAYQTGQKLSSYGRLTDDDVTSVEAVMASFGFRTKTETGYQKVKEVLYGERSFEDNDAKEWYKELKRQLSRRGVRATEADYTQRVLAEAIRVFDTDRPRFVEIIQAEIEKDAQDGDFVMLMSLINRIGLNTEEEMWDLVNKLPNGDVRDKMVETLQAREEMMNGD